MPRGHKKRFVKKRVNSKIKVLTKKISKLALTLKPEVKRFFISAQGFPLTCSQVWSTNSSGHVMFETTPIIAVGTGYQNRIGTHVKIMKSVYNFQFYQQTSTITDVRVRLLFFETSGSPETLNVNVQPTAILNPNQWLAAYNGFNIYDFYSALNPDAKATYKFIKEKRIIVKKDNMVNQVIHTNLTVTFSKPRIMQYSHNTTIVRNGQQFVIVLCDSGNAHPAVASTLLGLVTGATNTGLNFNYSVDYFYTDL